MVYRSNSEVRREMINCNGILILRIAVMYLSIGILLTLPVLFTIQRLRIKAFTDKPILRQLLWFAYWIIIWPYSIAWAVMSIILDHRKQ